MNLHMGRSLWNAVKWRMHHARLPRNASGGMMLHIGCGDVNAPGYINIDARPLPHVHFVSSDLSNLSFVPEGALSLIYMCHILEHVPHQQVVRILRQCHSRLAAGGICRVSVPDFDLILQMYEHTGHDMRAVLGPLMGGQDYRYNFHLGAFNRGWLTTCFEKAGFVSVEPWTPDTASEHDFVDWSGRTFDYQGVDYPISLNLQATRASR